MTGSNLRPDARLIAIDLARFVAIIGMVAVHTLAATPGNPLAAAAEGNASTLFAVLAGVGVVLSSRRRMEVAGMGSARVALVARGAAVAVLGLLLGMLPTSAVVILVYLGVSLCVAALFLRVRTRVLLATAAALAVVVPPLNVAVRSLLGIVNEGGSVGADAVLHDPVAALRGVLLTGTYPVGTWLVYLLVGMALGRALVRAGAEPGALRSLAPRMIAGGVAAALVAQIVSWVAYDAFAREAMLLPLRAAGVPLPAGSVDELLLGAGFGAPTGWPGLLLDVAHTGSLLDIVRGAGIATAVIGALLLIRRDRPRALRILQAAGAAPLTAYALHLTTLAVVGLLIAPDTMPVPARAWSEFALNVALVVALGGALAATRARGPLERGVAVWAGWVSRSVRG